MNTSIKIALLFCLFAINSFSQTSDLAFEKSETFFPGMDIINNANIEWGYFTVPESWGATKTNKIKLAVAILKKKSDAQEANPVVMIDGGPGGSAIEGIWYFLNHPLRAHSDIILVDARGTGFSEPRLCPDLGKEFLQILAKNQSVIEDEKEKADAAMACNRQLIAKGIDVDAYHSVNISKDLHALKTHLNYPNWNVYGVSYGTHVAQVYADNFPNDIKTLILDSPISDIKEYYTQNTSNYVSSLNKVFKACESDPKCNSEYPDLEQVYYETIAKLNETPVTVNVEKTIIEAGTFTYNAEDFKVAIHQALYQQKLIEVLPLLIYQFHEGNENALSSMVSAFSGALGLDYGMYYCVTCNETIPNNSFNSYKEDAKKYAKLNGGLSFYKSDFIVCDQWNEGKEIVENTSLDTTNIAVPTLIFTGEFDPITPVSNGVSMASNFEKLSLLNIKSYGHASSFSWDGFEVVNKFVNASNLKLRNEDFGPGTSVAFANDVHLNGGVSKFGNSINEFDLIFFSPLLIAFVISFLAIFIYLISLFKNRDKNKPNKWMKGLLIINSILGVSLLVGFVLALKNTASSNFYLLAFGLPEEYSYLFTLLFGFIIILLLSLAFFFIQMKKIENRSTLFTVLFSNSLIAMYFFYWEVFMF